MFRAISLQNCEFTLDLSPQTVRMPIKVEGDGFQLGRSGAGEVLGEIINSKRIKTMKRSVIIAAAIFAIVSSTGAFAKAITDTIRSVDRKGDSITLMNGRVFKLPEKIEVERFKAGEKVRVNYSTTKAGRTTVSSIHPVM
ncbi:DUF1344 domain-containing protein [Rhizobium jaguaris]|uniref:DUF1344 domain-containing protein n=1 Tax=Rhizobium jaguaris TaxID=1312183 RepID=UPI0039BED76E